MILFYWSIALYLLSLLSKILNTETREGRELEKLFMRIRLRENLDDSGSTLRADVNRTGYWLFSTVNGAVHVSYVREFYYAS